MMNSFTYLKSAQTKIINELGQSMKKKCDFILYLWMHESYQNCCKIFFRYKKHMNTICNKEPIYVYTDIYRMASKKQAFEVITVENYKPKAYST